MYVYVHYIHCLRIYSVGSKLISGNSVRAVYACECLRLQEESMPFRDAQCSVRGCPLSFPVYRTPRRCSGYLEVIVHSRRVVAIGSVFEYRVTIIFKHPLGLETQPLLPKGKHPVGELRVAPIYRPARPEMDAAVARDMELLGDPMFFSYIKEKLDRLNAIGPIPCRSSISQPVRYLK